MNRENLSISICIAMEIQILKSIDDPMTVNLLSSLQETWKDKLSWDSQLGTMDAHM